MDNGLEVKGEYLNEFGEHPKVANRAKISGMGRVLHLNGNTLVIVNLIYLRKVSSYSVLG